jgi:hypothetical protein
MPSASRKPCAQRLLHRCACGGSGKFACTFSHVLVVERAVEALQLLQRRESPGRVVVKIA